MMLKNAIARLVASLLVMVLAVGETGAVPTAPINPAFKEWQRRKSDTSVSEKKSGEENAPVRRLLSADSGVKERRLLGHIPSTVDYSYLKNINYQQVAQAATVTFPARFDLRDEGKLTSVKYQNPWGTCWAHATIGSLESGILMGGGASFDFSEWHLANTHGFDYSTKNGEGGNGDMAIAYLTRWSGPISESQDPYPSVYRDSPVGMPLGHVQNVKILTPMSTPFDTDEIKKTLMEHGSIYAGYLHLWAAESPDEKSYYWNGDPSMYQSKSDGGGHAVQIVGWDDNYSKSKFRQVPPGNGAFICKNSWGTSYGENGYFYVSYYDAVFGADELYSFFELQDAKNYDGVYQYDPLGHVNNCGGTSPCWGANIFRCGKENEEIAAVGFYSLVKNTKYVIEIYTDCSDSKPTSGNCQVSQAGTCDFVGYVTVPLSSCVQIEKGRLFSVVVKLTTPGWSHPLAYEAYFSYEQNGKTYWTPTSEATASAGQSFMSQNGTSWLDFTTAVHPTANFCCKAYTKSSAAPVKTLSSVGIMGVNSLQSGKPAQFTCKAKYSDGSDADVTKNSNTRWSIASGSDYASVDPIGLVTAKSVTQQQTVKVHAEYTECGIPKNDDWTFYVTIAPPEPPTNLAASQGTDASCVRVTWTAPSGASSYAVYRGTTTSSGNATFVQTVTVPKYNDNDAKPGVTYTYFVKAKNDSGTSDFSNGASGYKKLAPPEVRASDGTRLDGVELQWSEVAGAAYYRVYRADDPEEGAEKKAISGWIPQTEYLDDAAEAGVTYYYYVVAAVDGRGNRPSDCSIIEDGYRGVPVVPQSLEISGGSSIPSGGSATYTCDLIYSNDTRDRGVAASWSIVSGPATVQGSKVTANVVSSNGKVVLKTTYGGLAATKTIQIAAVKPHAPISAPVVSVEENGIRVNWDTVADATSYSVFRKSGSVEVFIGNAIGKTNYLDDKAQPGVTYTYRISAGNSAGNGDDYSPYSDPVSLSLSAPSGVTATTDDPDKVTVAWKAVTGAKSYRVYRAESESGSKTALGSGWQSGRFYEDTTGTAGKTYYYFVQAAVSTTGSGAGAYSAGAVGKRPQPVALQSIEICDGATRVASGGRTVFTCKAHYSDGKGASVVPEWSVSPSGYATIDANGQLVASKVTSDQTVEVVASYGGKTASPVSVRIVASVVATAKIVNVRTSTRWPFSGLMDIDYELQTIPSGTKAFVSVSGFDNDRQMAMAARTLSGDGATGTAIEAGAHRLSWDVAADYPKFRSSSLGVDLTAVPVNIFPPSEVSATPDSLAGTIMLTWSSAEDATGYEVWRGTSASIANAEKIGTVSIASFTDNSAVAGTTCYYWVRSVGEGGSASEFGTPVTAKVNPITYTIYFNANGGSGTMSSLPMVCGTAKNLPAVAFVPPHEVRTFDGWALSPTGPVVYHDQESVNNLTTVDCGSVTLYAVWKRGSVNLMPLKSVLAVLKMCSVGGKLTTDTVVAALNNPTLVDMDGDTSRVSDQEREVLLEIRGIIERDGVFECIAKGDYNSDLITDDDLLRWNEMSRMIENMKKN